ncbi:DUF6415 family natural product biosynthesis protein [Streptomyces sp. NPDC021096]|uniref:DUF6415 family natural product biosynthesis protein n=1 Tax=Streptomyces sp. NPDC021096 TaxID=3154792 RepID=UPI0033F4C68B
MTVTVSDQPACDTATEMSQYLADAIRRALSHPVPLPRHEEVEETTERLRNFLERLLPEAESHISGMVRGTAEWHLAQSTVDVARHELATGPGSGLRSAVLHMQDWGRACHHMRGLLPGHHR